MPRRDILPIVGTVRLFLLALPLVGCLNLAGCSPSGPGYGITIAITVPLDVQQAFSMAQPGLVTDNFMIAGRLCAPTVAPITFQLADSYGSMERLTART